jgi:O-antigen/teichoic acid export membrane protein
MEQGSGAPGGTSEALVRPVIWSGLDAFGKVAIQLATTVVLARVLAPAEFGIAAIAAAIVFWLNVFVEHGFVSALVQREDLRDEHLHSAFWIASLIGAAIVAVLILVAGPIEHALGQPGLAPLLRGYSMLLLVSSSQGIFIAVLSRNLGFREIAISTWLGRALGALMAVVLALEGYGPWSLVAQQVGTYFVSAAALGAFARWRPHFILSAPRIRELSGFAIAELASEAAYIGANQLFHLAIGQLLGPSALGIFHVASRIAASATNALGGVVQRVGMAIFSRLQGHPEALGSAIAKTNELACALGFPALLGVFAVAEPLVRILLGEDWLHAVPLVRLLSLGCVCYFVQVAMETAIDALGRPVWQLAIAVVEFTVVLGVLVAMLDYGILAAGLASLAGRAVAVPATYLVLGRFFALDWREISRSCMPALVAGGLMVAVVSTSVWALADHSDMVQLLASVPLGAAVYLTTLRLGAPELIDGLLAFLVRSRATP